MATTNNDNDSAMTHTAAPPPTAETDKKDAVRELSEHLQSLTFKLGDKLWNQLQHVFTTVVVPNFPRLENPQTLVERLKKSYEFNVDKLEYYVGRKILTLNNLPPNRLARIAELFQTVVDTNDDGAPKLTLELHEPQFLKNLASQEEAAPDRWENMKSQQQHITREQVEEKYKAIETLRREIVRARQKKSVLERTAQELVLAKKMTENVQNLTGQEVHTMVSNLMKGFEELEMCRQQGEQALQQIKKRRAENAENETDNDLAGLQRSPQPKTVEEFYQKERKRLKGCAKLDELEGLNGLLTKNKKSGN